ARPRAAARGTAGRRSRDERGPTPTSSIMSWKLGQILPQRRRLGDRTTTASPNPGLASGRRPLAGLQPAAPRLAGTGRMTWIRAPVAIAAPARFLRLAGRRAGNGHPSTRQTTRLPGPQPAGSGLTSTGQTKRGVLMTTWT